jgi:DNA-directed RNA polymerase subunit RPC12/RpoP
MEYCFNFQKCSKCGREFLVEKVLFGIDHTVDTIVTCKECLAKSPLPETFIKEFNQWLKCFENYEDFWLTYKLLKGVDSDYKEENEE